MIKVSLQNNGFKYSNLEKEYEKDKWINNYLKSAKQIKFIIANNKAFYLRECLIGDNLCSQKYLDNPMLLIDLLVDALIMLHSIKISDQKFIIDENYNTLIHGDFCLPNILAKDDKIVGFIDLGDCGIGDPW